MHPRQFRIRVFFGPVILAFLFAFYLSLNAQSTSDTPPSYEHVHQLTEQGKFDEALPSLNKISKSNRAAKNLAHEFAVLYYPNTHSQNPLPSLQHPLPNTPTYS